MFTEDEWATILAALMLVRIKVSEDAVTEALIEKAYGFAKNIDYVQA